MFNIERRTQPERRSKLKPSRKYMIILFIYTCSIAVLQALSLVVK